MEKLGDSPKRGMEVVADHDVWQSNLSCCSHNSHRHEEVTKKEE